MRMAADSPRQRADLALLGVSALWGLSFPAIKLGSPHISPLLFVAVRFALASLLLAVLGPWLARHGGGLAAPACAVGGLRRRGWALGVLLALGYGTQTVGLQTTSAGNSAFITSLSVILVPLIVAARGLTRPPARVLAAMLPALAGLGLLTRPDLGRPVEGDLWTLACAVSYAVYLVELSRALARYPFLPLLQEQLRATAALAAAWAVLFEARRFALNGQVLFSLGATTLLATVLALYLQNRFQGRTTATRAALIFTTEPVFAALFAAAILGDRLPAAWLAGAGLILGAVVLAELPGRREEAR